MKHKSIAALAAFMLVGGAVLGSAPAALADEVIPTDPAVVQEVAPEPISEPVAEPAPAVEAPVAPVEEAAPVEVVPTEEPVAAPDEAVVTEAPAPAALARTVAPSSYVIAAWLMPSYVDDHTATWAQTLATSQVITEKNLGALDEWLSTQCGAYQIDGYLDDKTTAELITGAHLYGSNNPEEHLWGGGWGEAYKVVNATGGCTPPPTNTQCESFTDGGTSTNLDANGWVPYDTRSAGHAEYVAGGLHIYTDDNSSNAKIQWAKDIADFPLSQTGQISADYDSEFGLLPGVKLNVTFASGLSGTLVWEEVYGGQDLWLPDSNNAAIVAPQTGGGFGSNRHGTINEWLSVYPDAVVTAIQFGIGSGAFGGGVLHSIDVGCATYSFDYVPPVVVAAQFDVTPVAPSCDVAGTFDTSVFPIDREFYTLTVDRPFDGPGEYTITATPKFNVILDGPVSKTITVEGAIGYQSENEEAPCYLAPPVEVTPSVVVHDSCGTTDDSITFGNEEGLVYSDLDSDGNATVTAEEGYVIVIEDENGLFSIDSETGIATFHGEGVLTDEACPVVVVPPTEPPVVVTPPAPPAQVAGLLASTGVNNLQVLLVVVGGLLALGLFFVLVAVGRKRTDRPAARHAAE